MEIVALLFLFAVFSAALAAAKNRSAFGWLLLGLLFGPFGLLVAFFPSKPKKPKKVLFDGMFAQTEASLDHLELLEKAHNEGVITDEEFKEKRSRIINKIPE